MLSNKETSKIANNVVDVEANHLRMLIDKSNDVIRNGALDIPKTITNSDQFFNWLKKKL